MSEKLVTIKNHRKVEVILGAINIDDPSTPGAKYERMAETIAPGGTSQPMSREIFQKYDVPAVAAMVESGELELFVDGESKAKKVAARRPVPMTVAQALTSTQAPSASDEEQEAGELADLLAPKPE